MKRPFNFSAGPAALPDAVLEQAAAEMPNWQGQGISVMETSHRSADVESMVAQAESDLRDLLLVPPSYRILFIQASATALNAIVPMNLVARQGEAATIDVVHTGVWSGKSLEEARKYTQVNVAATSGPEGFTRIPDEKKWRLTDNAAYVHICSNETINGTEFFFVPDTGVVPLVADMSSHILSRPVDVTQYGLILAGAQKNMGIAGVSVVIVHDDLIGHALPICPSVFDFCNLVKHNSMPNTPPVYAIYMCGLVFRWLKQQGGVAAMEAAAIRKSSLLYECLDASSLFVNRVEKPFRSRMNVPFALQNEALNDDFLSGAAQNGLLNLEGHRTLGGMRASLYNAMPAEGVERLVSYMREFERTH